TERRMFAWPKRRKMFCMARCTQPGSCALRRTPKAAKGQPQPEASLRKRARERNGEAVGPRWSVAREHKQYSEERRGFRRQSLQRPRGGKAEGHCRGQARSQESRVGCGKRSKPPAPRARRLENKLGGNLQDARRHGVDDAAKGSAADVAVDAGRAEKLR